MAKLKSNVCADRDLYLALSKKITIGDKTWLLDVDGDYERYRERLRELAKKYALEV